MTMINVQFDSLDEMFQFSLTIARAYGTAPAAAEATEAAQTERKPRKEKADKKADTPQEPAKAPGIELFKSDGTSAGAAGDSPSAAKILVLALKSAPDRASLDNLLTVNARAMQQMVDVDSAGVTRAYAEMCSAFSVAQPKTETAAKTDGPKSELDDLMGETGVDNASPGMPTDPKELKEAVRTMTSKQIDKLGMEKAREWIAKYGPAFSKVPADKYPALWTELNALGITA
jgi:hypothetical protein